MRSDGFTRRGAAVLLAALLCVAATAGTALAYYTDTARASGMVPLAIPDDPPPSTEVEEELVDGSKDVVVRNTGDVPALVRVRVICAEANADVAITRATPDWVLPEGQSAAGEQRGWYYYNRLLAPGEATSVLHVGVEPKEGAAAEFDVVVVQQCAAEVTSGEAPLAGLFAGVEVAVPAQGQPIGPYVPGDE